LIDINDFIMIGDIIRDVRYNKQQIPLYSSLIYGIVSEMIENGYCEIVIRYTKHMPSTSLRLLELELKEIGDSFTPKLPIKLERLE